MPSPFPGMNPYLEHEGWSRSLPGIMRPFPVKARQMYD